MKERTKNILVFSMILAICFIFSILLFQHHLVTDAYQVMEMGYENVAIKVLGNGRAIDAALLLFVNQFHIEYETLYMVFTVVSIMMMAITVMILYQKLKSFGREQTKKQKIIFSVFLLLVILGLVFNFSYAESLLYLNNITMTFSLLLSVIASIVFTSKCKGKTIITFVLLLIATFSYQITVGIFVVLAFTFEIIQKGLHQRIKITKIIQLFIMIGIPLGLNYAFTKGILPILGIGHDGRLDASFVTTTLYCLSVCLEYLVKNVIVWAIFTVLAMLMRKAYDKNVLLNCIILFVISILASTMMTFGNLSVFTFRMQLTIFTLSNVYTLILWYEYQQKKERIILFGLAIILLIFHLVGFQYQVYLNIHSTKVHQEIFQDIRVQMEQYEQETGEQITKITFYSNRKETLKRWNYIPYYCSTYVASVCEWSVDGVFHYYLGKTFDVGSKNESIEKEFQEKRKNGLDTGLIKFIKNTMHIYIY